MHTPNRQPHQRFHPVTDDFREPYARDRDRVIHSSSFRRLEYKTQVFINSIGDYFRTRLTHSLEVSQIARSIAKNLGFNESLAEVIALSHDLGHTPFGHAGGDELDKVLKDAGFSNGFEHNYQSFRVVTKLEKRYAQFDGLNLTYATLEGILKHSAPYDKPFFDHRITELFDLATHPCLEAVIVDHADEIAYLSHDIDDGVKYGLITFAELDESDLVQQITALVHNEGIRSNDKIFRYRFSGHLINHLVYSFLDNSHHHSYPKDRVLSGALPANEPLEIGFAPDIRQQLRALKSLLFKKLYRHEQVLKKMFYGRHCIRELFRTFIEEPNLMPQEHVELLEHRPLHRVVADYIAGMSDRHAMELYRELYVG